MVKWKYRELILKLKCYYLFRIQILLQLISIPGCDNKSRTMSVFLLCEAQLKGVLLKLGILFHKSFEIEMSGNSNISIL